MVPLIIVLGIIIVATIVVISMYNSLVRAKTRVDETWKQIDVRLQNRYDLLPDLIQAVEKATTTDKDIQTKIAEVRSAVQTAKTSTSTPENASEVANVQNALTASLQGLKISVEAYPEIRSQEAIQNFMNQDQIIEEKIAGSRQIYNSTAREYNEKIVVVPTNIIAGMFNLQPVTYFEASQEAQTKVGPDWGAKIVSK